MRLAYPAGMTSRDLESEMCYNSLVGQYSDITNSMCTLCPHGLTTEHEASTSKTDCSRRSLWIRYVNAVMLLGPAPTCECRFEFTKENEGL